MTVPLTPNFPCGAVSGSTAEDYPIFLLHLLSQYNPLPPHDENSFCVEVPCRKRPH